MRFEDVLISFPDAVPCGIKVASYGGKIILNPDDCYVLQEGDEVIVIAEDDDTYAPAPLPKVILSCDVSFSCYNLQAFMFSLIFFIAMTTIISILISNPVILEFGKLSLAVWVHC